MEGKQPLWNQLLVQFGLGAFETMRCINGQIPLLHHHFDRLDRALHTWRINNYSLQQSWEKHHIALNKEGQFRVKWILGLDDDNKIISHLYQQIYQKPQGPFRYLLLRNPFTQKQSYKSCSYETHWLASKKARDHECFDAIYQTEENLLVECSRASLAMTKANRGFLAQGPNLRSVCAEALLKQTPTFWEKKEIFLNEIDGSQLWACNALHGLHPIDSIVNEQGEELYHSSKQSTLQQDWNTRLFHLKI